MKDHYDDSPSSAQPVIIDSGAPITRVEPSPPQRGLLQTVGLAPTTAISAIAVDTVLFSGNVASMGLLLPFSILSAGVLGWISYRWQRRWGDDHDLALTKAVLIGLLTAIPAPITWLFAGPAGVAGLFKKFSRK